jgi:hypothetical protein
MNVPSGTELARPFLPAKDVALSKRFYEVLGFDKIFDGEVAIFQVGSGGFILQNYFVEAWASNCMMQLMVDDLDFWWDHLKTLDLEANLGVPKPRPRELQGGDEIRKHDIVAKATSARTPALGTADCLPG